MAYDLVARLKLVDNMSQPARRAAGNLRVIKNETDAVSRSMTASAKTTSILEKAMDQTGTATKRLRSTSGQLRDSLGRFTSASGHATSALSSLSTKAMSVRGALSGASGAAVTAGGSFRGMVAGVTALAGAYVTAQGAVKAFEATVGAAAKQEYEKITIRALVQDDKKANNLFDTMKKQALESPMFSLQDFLGSAKAYLPITRDLKQVEKLTSLTERLALSNPMQGLEGASFSIREAMSGDMVSLVERFNLPKKWVGALKGKEGDAFIREMDRLLNRIGYTDKLRQQVADQSGLAKYEQVKEKFSQGLTDMGFEGLERAKPILDRIDKMFSDGKFNRLQNFGSDIIAGAIGGLEKVAIGLDSFVTKLNNDPAWNKLSISDKFVKMTEIGMDSVVNYLNSGGSEKIASASSAVMNAAMGIGGAVGKGMLDGVGTYFKQHPMGAALAGMMVGLSLPGGPLVKAFGAAGLAAAGALMSYITQGVDSALKQIDKVQAAVRNVETTPYGRAMNRVVNSAKSEARNDLEKEKLYRNTGRLPQPKPIYGSGTMTAYEPSTWEKTKNWFGNAFSHYNGIERVPYDGYKAILHKEERVVPANENRGYSQGKHGLHIGNISVAINGSNATTAEQARQVAMLIVKEIEMAGGAMA
ncbi:hypothetical protein [Aneurinibacillus sp. REN35]|uniref:hypothetical protein n=2 Tax=Paenibacillaceae TaxID=186822 RepID=UPI0035272754